MEQEVEPSPMTCPTSHGMLKRMGDFVEEFSIWPRSAQLFCLALLKKNRKTSE